MERGEGMGEKKVLKKRGKKLEEKVLFFFNWRKRKVLFSGQCYGQKQKQNYVKVLIQKCLLKKINVKNILYKFIL